MKQVTFLLLGQVFVALRNRKSCIYIFNESFKKLHLYSSILKDSDLLQRFINQ